MLDTIRCRQRILSEGFFVCSVFMAFVYKTGVLLDSLGILCYNTYSIDFRERNEGRRNMDRLVWLAGGGNAISSWFQEFGDTFHKCFIKEDRYQLLLDGIGVTIKVSLLAAILGLIIGFLIAVCNLSKKKYLNVFGKIYTDVIRGTPSVTQLMIIYFVVFASVHWEKWIIAAIAFAINSGAYVSEIIRAGILSIDKGQTEAGRSLGLNNVQTMFYIVIPQAIKNIFPAMCNEFITLIKETAIVGYVGLVDIQKAGDFIKSATYEAFMPLIATAIIYFVLIKILTTVLGKLEVKLRKSDIR